MVFTRDKKKQMAKKNKHTKYRVLLWTAVAAILFFCSANARLNVKQLESFQKGFIGSKTKVIINPDGPLNLLRGYVYQVCGFMHNKRSLSPEIDVKYSLEPNTANAAAYTNAYSLCSFKRASADDAAYKASSEEKKYSYNYHRTLIKMFPSLEDYRYIDSTSTNSFISFLRAKSVEEHALHFLAALLLLSEGVEVPLECVDKRIVLQKKSTKRADFFGVDTTVTVWNATSNGTKDVMQTEAVEVLRFFKDSAKKEELRRIEDLRKREFLDTPQFLIQTYLFEFIESVEEAKELSEAVYEILCDMYPEQKVQLENSSIDKTVPSKFSKYFVSIDSTEEACVYLEEFKNIRSVIRKEKVFPFSDKSQIPSPIRVPIYDYALNDFDTEKCFENTLETMLYTLFCCLLYNPETEKYSLEKVSNRSNKLRDFFREYSRPVDRTSSKMLKDWSRVVSDLTTREVVYLEKRNKLDIEGFNFFLAIAEITAKFSIEGKKLVELRDEVKEIKDDMGFNPKKLYTEVCNYMQDMLNSLCVSDIVEIKCKARCFRSVRKTALFIISLENSKNIDSSEKSSIKLNLNEEPIIYSYGKQDSSFILTTEDIDKLLEIKSQLGTKEQRFMHSLLIQYIDGIIETATKDLQICEEKASLIKEIVESGLKNINSLFVLGQIEDSEYKRFIMGCCLSWAEEKKIQLDSQSPIVRFISNILGSLSSESTQTHIEFLTSLAYTPHQQSIYPSIKLSGELLPKPRLMLSTLQDLKSFHYILYTNSTEVLARILREYALDFNGPTSMLQDVKLVIKVFDFLFRDNDIHAISALLDSVFQRNDNYKMTSKQAICLLWFVLACKRETPHPELIKKLYDYINIDEIDIYDMENRLWNFSLFYKENKEDIIIIRVIKEKEKKLAHRKGRARKFKQVLNFFVEI